MVSSSEDEADQRFARFATDPRFRSVPRKQKKVSIDKRFGAMFNDKRFHTKTSAVDKRGRPVPQSSKEDYRRYYRLNDGEDEDEDSDEDSEEDEEEAKSQKLEIKARLRDLSVDYARGEANLASDSSSEEESSSDEEDEKSDDDSDGGAGSQFDKWGELDRDAESTEEATSRLAVCNMDWDRVGAEDIFIAMASFCPVGGSVKRVRVFVSEFGKKRLEEEDRLGPEELRLRDAAQADAEMSDDEDGDEDPDRAERRAMERVRAYQVNRLRYFYAVAEFDSAESASRVYEQCDGHEYELSATRFDLRFIPDDMDFDGRDVKGECSTAPDPAKYKPKLFTTTALQQGKVELTWDEVDPRRTAAMQKAFEKASDDEDDEHEVRAYLGSEDEGKTRAIASSSEDEEDEKATIAKYKALLGEVTAPDAKKDVDEDEEEEEEEGNMEMVFREEDEKVKSGRAQKELESLTPWEQYLKKKKDKKRLKKEKLKKDREDERTDEAPPSNNFDDPFFDGEDKVKRKKRKKLDTSNEEGDAGDLGLLVMDSDDDKEHFDYKEIVKQESKKKKKKKRGRGDEDSKSQQTDNFKLDLQDKRFEAIFHHADFNVDPSHPSFKKTKSMQEVIAEKQKRILEGDLKQRETPMEPKAKKQKASHSNKSDIDRLLKSVRSKASRVPAQKAKKAKR